MQAGTTQVVDIRSGILDATLCLSQTSLPDSRQSAMCSLGGSGSISGERTSSSCQKPPRLAAAGQYPGLGTTTDDSAYISGGGGAKAPTKVPARGTGGSCSTRALQSCHSGANSGHSQCSTSSHDVSPDDSSKIMNASSGQGNGTQAWKAQQCYNVQAIRLP